MCIDCQDVIRQDVVLFTQLINYPGEVIPLFDSEANILAAQLTGFDVMNINLKAPPLLALPQADGPAAPMEATQCWNSNSALWIVSYPQTKLPEAPSGTTLDFKNEFKPGDADVWWELIV